LSTNRSTKEVKSVAHSQHELLDGIDKLGRVRGLAGLGEEVGPCKYILQARKRQMPNVAYTYATEHNC